MVDGWNAFFFDDLEDLVSLMNITLQKLKFTHLIDIIWMFLLLSHIFSPLS